MAIDRSNQGHGQSRKMAGNWVQLGVFFVALLVIAIVINIFAVQDMFRLRVDATKTRAYSLSPRTELLLNQLEGDWTVVLATLGVNADPAMQRQITEVLNRYQEYSDNINIVNVDLTDPSTLPEYDLLMLEIQARYQTSIDQYNTAIDEAFGVYEKFLSFAQSESLRLTSLLSKAGGSSAAVSDIEEVRRNLSLLVEKSPEILAPIVEARATGVDQPIPDYELARSIMAAAAQDAALKLLAAVRTFDVLVIDAQVAQSLRSGLLSERGRFERLGDELTAVSDRLRRLPYLDLTEIGRALKTSEVAVIVGPDRATVIPADQLFPAVSSRLDDRGEISFDMRFRGEQLVSAAIGSLLEEKMPLVVFVHGMEASVWRRTADGLDLAGAAAQLRSGRFEVEQWNVNTGTRPDPDPGQPVVWIVVPDPHRSGDIPDLQIEKPLVDATELLVAQGQPILLTLFPSRLHQYDVTDPWASIAKQLGIDAIIESIVIESLPTAEGDQELRELTLMDYQPGHPVAAAVHGLPTHFAFPVPLRRAPELSEESFKVLAQIEPNDRLAIADVSEVIDFETADSLSQAQPLVVAIERTNPVSSGQQRAVLVGSGFWLVSAILDQTVGEGGQKVRLRYPGNLELLIASVTWLAGLDDLIAQGPTSQEVARLRDITPNVQRIWSWLTLLALPGLCVLMGIIIWFVRRT
ncbi:MAG: hypothetical protein P8J86_06715 [Phycisphaerales bacterium]|nr:hypothetical protein [Phycisphaerales bacterium]